MSKSQQQNGMIGGGGPVADTDDFSDGESTPLTQDYGDSQRTVVETKGWDVFRNPPPKIDSGSMANQRCLEMTVQITKVIVYLLVFVIVLGSGVVAKGTILFMTSQLRANRTIAYCNKKLGRDRQWTVTLPEEERIAWIWCIIIAFAVPEFGTLIRSTRICIFKSWKKPPASHFLLVFLMETFHVTGLALMFMAVLPELDVVKGAMLTNCVCFVPGLLGLLSRNKNKDESKRFVLVLIDIAALAAQGTSFFLWPLLDSSRPSLWLIPPSLFLVSCGWWENYVSIQSPIGFVRALGRVKKEMRLTRYFTYMFISVWKIVAFFISTLLILHVKGETVGHLFTMLSDAFGSHDIMAWTQRAEATDKITDVADILDIGDTVPVPGSVDTPIYVLLLQIFGAYFTYIFGKFACKILIQGFSYAFPVNLTIPVSISLLIAACGLRNTDPCIFQGTIPDYLFYESPPTHFINDFVSKQYAWVWLLWLLSQTWITLHVWTPKCERLAATEKLFVVPMYNSLLIDQSMGLNRKRDDQPEVKVEDLAEIEKEKGDGDYETIYEQTDGTTTPPSAVKSSDHVTRIYACATMWHENKEEMMEFLKSILRLDEDQCARRVAQKYLKVVDPDYYEFETHIFFDDAFELSDHDENEQQVNRFVKLLVGTLDEAASDVHQTRMHVRAPKKYPTPYGGRLVWTLPGKTKMIAHLKDKSKIRHRKRWSQVMYMYYLLGHRLMELPISVDRKEVIAENTYLLTLDGDIDFQPAAVKLLVDLMKKNKNLGAACGRIHPVGSGPMVWYQMFEYAIGHWLQKATEHMIGCVLCSPGCFSLFRGKALMDDNVMKKYTTRSDEARHYVQYDQGEDRWLCTLLLQRGYRVEYSAASDAYTHAPEGFNEFYNQRRRWVPSTIANIMDLLMDAKRTIKINDNISLPYISYQILLMGGTILGPGTIFLMLVGAFVAAFKIDNWTSFYYNIIPILFFMLVCFTCKASIQLLCAQILSTGYAMIMMAVIVGTALQLGEDGIGSPSAIFLISLSSSFFIAACLHPQEFWCIVPGIIYLLSIPSMYLLLILYSIINLNVVSWGTREVQVKKTKKELEQEKKEAEEAKRKAKQKSLLGFLQSGVGSNDDEEGSIEISLSGLFKCMFCTHGQTSNEKQQLVAIAESLEQVSKRLEVIERAVDPHGVTSRRRASSVGSRTADHLGAIGEDPAEDQDCHSEAETVTSQNTEGNREANNFLSRPYWLSDEGLKKGEIDVLSLQEELFWKDLLEKYLYPIDEDKAEKARIAKDLKDLRDQSVFAFFMMNALFVLIVFLLQLNKDLLHVKWPFGIKTNITYDDHSQEVHITKEYLQLEPIGLVFVFFFALILVIQFTAMLFHRFGTFAHILASTSLDWYCCKKTKDLSEEALLSKHAVEIVRDLQRLDGMEGDYEEGSGSGPGRRKTIRNLEKSRRKTQAINTLDVAFRQRFFSMSEGNGLPRNMSTRRSAKAFKAFEGRRNSIMAMRRKSQMQTLGANNIYGVAGNPLGIQGRPSRSSQISVKDVFEGHAGHTNSAYEPDENTGSSLRLHNLGQSTWRDANTNI
ncbi:chitin synthase chs-2 isoform X2 [Bombus vosnesenskii]|uniref:chitin synthase n=3 Tax=Pyrobombus TaxID=144703 RepID=A0A6J3JZA1_9HYME|nr:chitin synthase chs-2 isoform X2 [Bombus impatiens]XP_033206758.1 chitin synthase chs-2 isoform X3 [Bombus vancouverensis nearcticus]XP_033313058.1 chitin synthase chs-2 isoform X3 [Bombus bifarius]XP_033345490.1 chitin synthase chs-2 isoform X2 [Bombus vosnesenskii]XP_050471017.1 chitin synthase chs-2 isoform X1 [Bombus huntii]XP_050471021.1 chitin synthase chs-2 isoform X1 [Bombus huntii]